MKKHIVDLTRTEYEELRAMIKAGIYNSKTVERAHSLLMSSEGMLDEVIADTLDLCVRTVERIRDRYARGGLMAALADRPRSGAPKKLNANREAQLIAIACSKPPKGHRHWTNDLLAAELVKREVVETISRSAVYSTLKKTWSSPGGRKCGASPS